MNGLAETAAVHFGILDPEQEGQDGKESQQCIADDGRCPAKDAGNEADAHEAFQAGDPYSHALGDGKKEGHSQELEILGDNEHGSHRVYQFKKTRDKEDYSQDAGRMAAKSLIGRLHAK